MDKKQDQDAQHYNQKEQSVDKEDKYIGHTINTMNFLIDSGASCHVINSNNGIKWLKKINSQIAVADNSTCNATEADKIVLQVQGLDSALQLEKVYLVPLFSKNIISVKCLTKQGYQITFKEPGC